MCDWDLHNNRKAFRVYDVLFLRQSTEGKASMNGRDQDMRKEGLTHNSEQEADVRVEDEKNSKIVVAEGVGYEVWR